MDPTSEPAPTAGTPPVGESKAQEQARLRRERRNAKIMAGGSDRLNKITSLNGRPTPAPEEPEQMSQTLPDRPSVPTPSRAAQTHVDDPPEVDITSMFQKPSDGTPMPTQQDILRQMLANTRTPPPPIDFMAPPPPGSETEDPMMRMMQQMLGGMGGNGDGTSGLPAGLAEMFGPQKQPEPESNINYIWRIIHAVSSLSLGLYAAISFTFTGSQAGRLQYIGVQTAPRLFWIFSTIELLLQSTRYFIDGGKLPRSGILGGLSRMLPEPYANYVRIFGRYSIIYTTIVSDAMVVVFVLGCVAWWKGLAGM